MIDFMRVHEERLSRRLEIGRRWNAWCRAASVEPSDRCSKDDDWYSLNAMNWADGHVHDDDRAWFDATYVHGYPDFDDWEPDVDDESHFVDSGVAGVPPTWNPFPARNGASSFPIWYSQADE